MINDSDKQIIREVSQKYKAKKVLLFGSSINDNVISNDIDIAVYGIPPKDFFTFYGDLIFLLSKPVDIVDLSSKSKFTDLIQEEGRLIYGEL